MRECCSWPLSSAAAMQQIGSERRESGHLADIVNRSKMTQQQTSGSDCHILTKWQRLVPRHRLSCRRDPTGYRSFVRLSDSNG